MKVGDLVRLNESAMKRKREDGNNSKNKLMLIIKEPYSWGGLGYTVLASVDGLSLRFFTRDLEVVSESR